jgi:type II secretory pathway pseudopilin PulG
LGKIEFLGYSLKMARARGNTLIEVMLCASLLALTLGLMAPLFGRTSRVVNRADRDAQSQQQALVAVRKLFSEAAYSSSASLRIDPADPTCCAFLSHQRTQSSSLPAMGPGDYLRLGLFTPQIHWQKMLVVFWRSADKTLNYKEFSYTHPQEELVLVQRNRLQTLIYRMDTPTRVVATGVTAFQVESPQRGLIATSITAERSWDKTFRCKLDLLFAIRNQ